MISSRTGSSFLAGPSRLIGLVGVALAAGLVGAMPVRAQSSAYGHGGSYHQVTPYGYDDSYAGPLIRGDYLGAPLTRFPRPTELVPSAWGYGTYGIPTVSGIRSAPVGTPTVYVVEPARAAARALARARPRILSRMRDGRWSRASEARPAPIDTQMVAGARVITVGVPRRQASLR